NPLPAHWSVIPIMTALAPSFQIVVSAIFRRVVEVCDGQNNLRSISDTVVRDAAILAFVARALTNPQTDLFPVLRIPRFILGSDRHYCFLPPMPARAAGLIIALSSIAVPVLFR